MTQAEAEAYLLGFINYETLSQYKPTSRTHDLVRFKAELIRLGWHPNQIPTVHVGGTNGKGTVSVLLERVLRAGGLRTGLYTSPHLRSMRERIQIDGRPVASRAFRDGVSRLAAQPPRTEGFRTTFEHLTALGFLAFQEAKVDAAVIEVGLGGRLDATNVLPPGRAVLTPISLDHTQILGRTVNRIAADKAHILKRQGTAFLMPQGPTAAAALLKRCRLESLEPIWTSRQVAVDTIATPADGSTLRIRGLEDYGTIDTRLLGRHQAANVAAVVAVAETLLPGDGRRNAVRRGLSGARVAGRLDLRDTAIGRVLFDGGHNPASARAVARAIREHLSGARVHAVIGMARDKNHRGYLNALVGCVSEFHFVATPSPRAASARMLRERAGGGHVHENVDSALRVATKGRPDVLFVGGSFLLVGEAMGALDLDS
jgi:dihydrofolate synthase/folylpolyglutamate synthase